MVSLPGPSPGPALLVLRAFQSAGLGYAVRQASRRQSVTEAPGLVTVHDQAPQLYVTVANSTSSTRRDSGCARNLSLGPGRFLEA